MNKQKVTEKTNQMDSIVDIAAKSPNPESLVNHPSCCSNIVVATILFILLILIITLGQFGFHDPEAFKSSKNKNKTENGTLGKEIDESRWIKASNHTCYSSECIEMSEWLKQGYSSSKWRILKYQKLMEEAGIIGDVLKFVKKKCLETEEENENSEIQEIVNVVKWPDNLITDPEMYPIIGLLRFDYPTPTTARISAEAIKEDLKDTEWRMHMVFQHLTERAGVTVDLLKIQRQAEEINVFKTNLTGIGRSDELQKVELEELEAILPQIKWSSLFDESRNLTIKGDMEYLKNLSTLLDNTGTDIISNYLFFKSIENFAPYMSRMVRNIFWIGNPKSIEESCMIQMDKIFSGKILIPEMGEIVKNEKLGKIVEDVLAEVHHSIKNNGWVKKTDDLEIGKINITYCPDDLMVEKLNKTLNTSMNYFTTIQTVFQSFKNCDRIKYSMVDKVLEIPTSFLQPPFFHPRFPAYLNYANIGSFIADEILTQLLYDTDSHFDKCYENPAFEHLPGDIAYRAYNKNIKAWDGLIGFDGLNDKELFHKSLCAINSKNDRFQCNSDVDKTICHIFDTH